MGKAIYRDDVTSGHKNLLELAHKFPVLTPTSSNSRDQITGKEEVFLEGDVIKRASIHHGGWRNENHGMRRDLVECACNNWRIARYTCGGIGGLVWMRRTSEIM